MFRSFSTSACRFAKKKANRNQANEIAEKVILGRPSNNLKVGVVGMPNIG